MGKTHDYKVRLVWTGAKEGPARDYARYSRKHEIHIDGKPPLLCSSDPAFRGHGERYNPEDMLVAALSACHMLWYLHKTTDNGIVVVAYEDDASGTMALEPGNGRFVEAVLRPRVTIEKGGDAGLALALHDDAHKECFIANSCNFPIRHEAEIIAATA